MYHGSLILIFTIKIPRTEILHLHCQMKEYLHDLIYSDTQTIYFYVV